MPVLLSTSSESGKYFRNIEMQTVACPTHCCSYRLSSEQIQTHYSSDFVTADTIFALEFILSCSRCSMVHLKSKLKARGMCVATHLLKKAIDSFNRIILWFKIRIIHKSARYIGDMYGDIKSCMNCNRNS
jgi:hypothetical protein